MSHDEWLAERRKSIGGSDAAAIVGLNPWVSSYSLWAEKTGRIPGFEGNLATEVGTYLEEFVAKLFMRETGKNVRRANAILYNDAYPWAHANVDRLIVGEDAGLEIKTTSELNLKKFKGGEYPAQYYVQCVHYLAITGKQKWYLAVLIGNRDFKQFEIERNDMEIKALMALESEFFEHVKNNTPPPIDGSESTLDAIQTIFPESTLGTSIDLSGVANHIQVYMALGDQIQEMTNAQNEHKAAIMAYMGLAEKGIFENISVSYKTQVRNTFDKKLFENANGPIPAMYFNTSQSRPFKLTIK